jgi:hypothetical protein
MTNYQVQQQHEKCARILALAIVAKTRSNKYLVEVNKLKTSQAPNNQAGESIWICSQKHRFWMKAYERLKGYYSKQMLKLIGDDYVSINSLATI